MPGRICLCWFCVSVSHRCGHLKIQKQPAWTSSSNPLRMCSFFFSLSVHPQAMSSAGSQGTYITCLGAWKASLPCLEASIVFLLVPFGDHERLSIILVGSNERSEVLPCCHPIADALVLRLPVDSSHFYCLPIDASFHCNRHSLSTSFSSLSHATTHQGQSRCQD
jgi:hypothetical protein